MHASSSDMRVTAFVFGELSGQDRLAFERELRESSQLREEVAALRLAISALESEFREATDEIDSDARRRLIGAVQTAITDATQRDRFQSDAIELGTSEDTPSTHHASAIRWHTLTNGMLTTAAVMMIAVGVWYWQFVSHQDSATGYKAATSPSGVDSQGNATQRLAIVEGSVGADAMEIAENTIPPQSIPMDPNAPMDPNVPMDPNAWDGLDATGSPTLSAVTVDSSNSIRSHVAGVETANGVSGQHGSIDHGSTGDTDSVARNPVRETHAQPIHDPLHTEPSGEVAMRDPSIALPGTARKPLLHDGETAARSAEVDMVQEATGVGGSSQLKGTQMAGSTGPHRPLISRPTQHVLGQSQEAVIHPESQSPDGSRNVAFTEPLNLEVEIARLPVTPSAFFDPQETENTDQEHVGLLSSDHEHGSPLEATRSDSRVVDNPFVSVKQNPVSAIPIKVDTASYSLAQALIRDGIVPPPESIRIEQWMNAFDYEFGETYQDDSFAVTVDIAGCPWNQSHRLARVGIKAQSTSFSRPPCNLVFVVDGSGSMRRPQRLSLVIAGIKNLIEHLDQRDSVAIMVYPSTDELILEPTRGNQRVQILAALDRLAKNGLTGDDQDISLAFEVARDQFISGGVNRIVFCTDQEAVGDNDPTQQRRLPRERHAGSSGTAASGIVDPEIALDVVGFGVPENMRAALKQRVADIKADCHFVNNRIDVTTCFLQQAGAPLVPVANNVAIQVGFHPQQVESYRLIGFVPVREGDPMESNRPLATKNVFGGQAVTALYEFVSVNNAGPNSIRSTSGEESATVSSDPSFHLRIRFQEASSGITKIVDVPAIDEGQRFSQTNDDFQFAAGVAALGMYLQDSPYRGNLTLSGIERLIRRGARSDRDGERKGFVTFVEMVRQLRDR